MPHRIYLSTQRLPTIYSIHSRVHCVYLPRNLNRILFRKLRLLSIFSRTVASYLHHSQSNVHLRPFSPISNL